MTKQEKRCEECGGELSYCGEMTSDGPSMGCRVCQLAHERDETIERLWEALKAIVRLGETVNGYTIALNAVNHERRLDAIKEEDEARERFDNGQFGAGA